MLPRWRAVWWCVVVAGVASAREAADRREAVVAAARHAYGGYAARAFGRDELRPVTGGAVDNFGGLGATLVDSLGTLWLFGMVDEYEAARRWVASEAFAPAEAGEVVVFETVIRILGGLVSAFQLTDDRVFLHRAEQLALALAPAFDSPTGIPYAKCNLAQRRCYGKSSHGQLSASTLLAEAGTVALEYRALAMHSHTPAVIALRAKAEHVLHLIKSATRHADPDRGPIGRGLAPSKISVDTGRFVTTYVTVGAPSDSYFEYLGKVWVQGAYQEDIYRDMLIDWVDVMHDTLLHTTPTGDTMVYELGGTDIITKMDHFSCYIPGVLSITADRIGSDTRRARWIQMAANITQTCRNMYARSPIGLAPENIRVHNGKWLMNGGYELRPEVLEAIFFMWRRTHDPKYREWAWEIFSAIERHCKTQYGYATLAKAKTTRPVQRDTMHSFFISETLRYLYLIFSDDEVLPLDKFVFNTEAHPLLIMPALGAQGGTSLGGADQAVCDANVASV